MAPSLCHLQNVLLAIPFTPVGSPFTLLQSPFIFPCPPSSFLSFPLLSLVQGSLNPCLNLIFVYCAILFYPIKPGFSNLTGYYKYPNWEDLKNTNPWAPSLKILSSWSEVSEAPQAVLVVENHHLKLKNDSLPKTLYCKCGLCAASAPHGSLLGMQILRRTPDLLNQNLHFRKVSGDLYAR